MKLLCRRAPGGLRPLYETDEIAMSKLKIGDVVTVEVRKPRNPQHHAKYFALMAKVFENQEHYETVEQLHNALKLAAGIYDPLQMPDGTIHKIPGSISFEKMDQTEFSAFYERVCDLIAKHFLPGVNSDELKAEVEEMIGARTAA